MFDNDNTLAAVRETAQRLAKFYEQAMLEHGLTKEEVDDIHLGVVRRELQKVLSQGI